MVRCTDLQKVWTHVKGHRRRVVKCLDPPKPKRKRDRKKKHHPKIQRKQPNIQRKQPKPVTVQPTYEDQTLQDIVPIRQFKSRAARKFAST